LDVYVARQAIFDRARRVHGYELLFRANGVQNEFDGSDPSAATAQVLANSLLAIGLENLVGEKLAFVNFDRELLLKEWHSLLPRRNAVIEVLETVEPDPQVLAACQKLREQGYQIALDDFVLSDGWEPMLGVANVLKIEVKSLPESDHLELVRSCHARGLKMLAEKVETYEEFAWARKTGYDYFQGFFFARPAIVHAKLVPVAKSNCIRLLREAMRPELDLARLDRVIAADVALSYKLLRYVNSALFSLPSKVQSIRHALTFLGDADLRRWIALAVLPRLAEDKTAELVTHSLVRARFCESAAGLANESLTEHAFLMGLFSLLDALIDRPLEELLVDVGLAPEVVAALLDTASEGDTLTTIYQLALHYEAGNWDAVDEIADRVRLTPSAFRVAYCEAVSWTQETLAEIPR
jgi:EAL and modified HD-GYP domain-containing signal transduction protein